MSKKKIALIGNVNNNLFALMRHLRDLGYDAHLFHRPENDHFQPKADTQPASIVAAVSSILPATRIGATPITPTWVFPF